MKLARIQSRAVLVFATYVDTEKTGTVGYKSIVAKISGFAKFDLDTKINKEHFYQIIDGMCRGESGQLDEDRYEQIVQVFEKAYRDGVAPFAGDLENETYKAIINRMRAFVPQ